MLSCHCLNVIIESSEDLQEVDATTLGLTITELEDHFFAQDCIRQVGKLVNINKTHSGLIQTRNVGSWVVHYCINCDVHSHAVHREKGASCVLVNSRLLSKTAIEKARVSENYSKLYKIVVDGIEDDNDVSNNSYLPNEVENIVRGFRQIAADGLKKEAEVVEDRIRAFTDLQYNKLSELRDKTFKEQQILTKILVKSSTEGAKPASTNSSMSNPQGMPSRLNEPLAAGSVRSASSSSGEVARHTPKRQKSLPVGRVVVWNELSFDAEGLFDFEGADDSQLDTAGSDVDDSDGDERDETVKVPRRNGATNRVAVAKSLPMTIPAFLSRNRSFEDVDDDVEVVESDTTDIAASIKALAKSVHGDTVFGDLPKPRYTYI